MTGKERAAFRKQANALDAIFQIGKEGLSGNMLVGIDNALNKRELIHVLFILIEIPYFLLFNLLLFCIMIVQFANDDNLDRDIRSPN